MYIGEYLETGHMNINAIGCFFEKDVLFYTIIMLVVLASLIVSARKAPRWVRPLGLIALSFTVLKALLTVIEYIDTRMVAQPDWDFMYGLRVCYPLTTVAIMGFSIYLLSIIINVIKTPRI